MDPIEERYRREKFLRTKCTGVLSNVKKKDRLITVRDGHSIKVTHLYAERERAHFRLLFIIMEEDGC